MEYILTASNIAKKYRKFSALNGLNIGIKKGDIYGLVGRNGSGKTTLIRLICGLQIPTAGELCLYGVKHFEKEYDKARRRLGAVVEVPALFMAMTAYNNLKQQFIITGNTDYNSINSLLELVGLADTGKKKVKNFSLGMKQRLGIAIALVGNPDFLILDEPINGLDPQGIIEIRELILKLNRENNITVLISSHILGELTKVATCYGFMEKGKIIKEISAEEIDKICCKYYNVEVSNIAELIKILDESNQEYSVIGDNSLKLYGDVVIAELVTQLAKRNTQLMKINEMNETLEAYYINLVGGGTND